MLDVLARIRHRRTRRQLSPYLDGMLSARESRRLEAHLARCQACRDELAELRATVQALAELPLAEEPRSFALTAAPRRAEALRPAARRLEFGLRLATATAALVLTVVLVGDLLGVRGGEEESSRGLVSLQAAPTQAGAREEQAPATGEDKSVTETPSQPPAGAAEPGQPMPSPPETQLYGGGGPLTGTPSSPPPVLAPNLEPGLGEQPAPSETPAAPEPSLGGATAETPAPAETPGVETPPAAGLAGSPEVTSPGPSGTPPPAGTPAPAGTPEEAPPAAVAGTSSATATPPPTGAEITPSEPEQQQLPSQSEQGLADAERGARAAEEGGPSRETVLRWMEIGLGAALALLFVSWFLARRRGQA